MRRHSIMTLAPLSIVDILNKIEYNNFIKYLKRVLYENFNIKS